MTTYLVTGNTYKYRDGLRQLGLTWDADRKAWVTADETIVRKLDGGYYFGRRAGERDLTITTVEA